MEDFKLKHRSESSARSISFLRSPATNQRTPTKLSRNVDQLELHLTEILRLRGFLVFVTVMLFGLAILSAKGKQTKESPLNEDRNFFSIGYCVLGVATSLIVAVLHKFVYHRKIFKSTTGPRASPGP